MRSDHFTDPSDSDGTERADLTQEFWGSDPAWVTKSNARTNRAARRTTPDARPRKTTADDGHTGSMQAIRDGFAAFRPQRIVRSGGIDRTREHGIVRPTQQPPAASPEPQRYEASLGELASGWVDEPIPHRPSTARRPVHPTDNTPTEQIQRTSRTRSASGPASRRHGVVASAPAVDPEWEELTVEPTRSESWASRLGLGAVDPLLVRLGSLAIVTLMLVPLALGARSDDAPTLDGSALEAPTEFETFVPSADPGESAPVDVEPAATASDVSTSVAPAANNSPAAAPVVAESASAVQETTSVAAESETSSDATVESSSGSSAAIVTESAERLTPPCEPDYTVAAGDSWYRIADLADVSVTELLSLNRATDQTVLLPGGEVCLPDGATISARTTTDAPADTTPTTTTAPTATPTTAVPETTVPATTVPTTTAPATTVPVVNTTVDATTAEVQELIREIWPDDLEVKALEIAFRESRYVANADNGWCCVGVFQIYWTVHQGWLDDYGIHTRSDLFDARKNIQAAYALYERSGGWGPWGG